MSTPPVDDLLQHGENEPIHQPGLIQPDGVLLVIDSENFRIIQVSANTNEWLGKKPDELLGQPVSQVLGAEAGGFLLKVLSHPPSWQPQLQPLVYGGHTFSMRAHHHDSGILVEMEPLPDDEKLLTYRLFSRLGNFFDEMELTNDPDRLLKMATRILLEVTGHESVMVYRFDPEWNGQVTIEERTDGQQRFLGHHFPASDIPAQARRLYRINRTRQISNVHYTPVPLVPAVNPHTGSLDLSRTQLRSVSPVHLEYMRNMGTLSSLTLSLMPDGHLWGLLVCHGSQPRYLCPQIRTFCSMVAQLVSENLQLALNRELSHQMSRLGRSIDLFNARFQAENDLAIGLGNITGLLATFEADAIALRLDGVDYLFGRPVCQSAIQCLKQSAHQNTRAGLAYAERVPVDLHGKTDWICGYLFLPLSASGDEYLVLLRAEKIATKFWAGEPAKAVREDTTSTQLSPRHSFAVWQEEIKGQSLAWERHHRAAASRLRRAINLRMASEMARIRQHDAEMAHLATHDSLTGLPNRLLVEDRLDRALAKARRERGVCVLMFVDLDGFKPINDQQGHDCGDLILQQVARRMESSIRESDTLARLGGDEFLFILSGFSSQSTARYGTETIATKLMRQFSEPFVLEDGRRFNLGASIGIALYPFDAETPEALIKAADQAMYKVKENGRNNYHFFSDGHP
ncbi:bifunctional diguanylate cyclase/phosphodiesterase [Marinospirillum alkaliphilum]|uniref:Diguanylate cyclase (GGDEF) domain-containing protein n=1 Tax=Marinospirillum alkaliphilum DSM 21637 TaxID=1122209 RepID=A0A1K1U9Q2_9GAMM|nr:sensor domain-containing diguanylate cyclase [Marinospirillum alkaliphilum]SFX09575.1 diguanylate cyclase (GGDEF) domain-containing protein [Marinospirillum alkaliphilum DSM 21637]